MFVVDGEILLLSETLEQDDSLYVCFFNYIELINLYGICFNNAIHANLVEGKFDPYGLNYFSIIETKKNLEIVLRRKPYEYQKFTEFLETAKKNNGFYIHGI